MPLRALWAARSARPAGPGQGKPGLVRALLAVESKGEVEGASLPVRHAGRRATVDYTTRMTDAPYLAIQVVMMPRDTNPHGTIFGGVILSYLDQAGAIGARREVIRRGGAPPFVVTVAMNKVEFRKPVLVGDVVRFLTRPVRVWHTSITIQDSVEAERSL